MPREEALRAAHRAHTVEGCPFCEALAPLDREREARRAALATPEPPEPSVSVEAAWEALLGDFRIQTNLIPAYARERVTFHRPAIEAQARADERRRLAGLRGPIRAAITNAYYDARNAGWSMETAADNAQAAVLALLSDTEPAP